MEDQKFVRGERVLVKYNSGTIIGVYRGMNDTRYEVALADGPEVIFKEDELLSIDEAVTNASGYAPFQGSEVERVIDGLTEKCHAISREHGFWDYLYEFGSEGGDQHLLQFQLARVALFGEECGELVDALRHSEEENIGLDPHVAEECADIAIRLFDFCAGFDIDLGRAIIEKMEKNKSRPYKHGKKA
jgi:NTP pyrophosphatase (non-canonical NTP hydrolase)